MAHGTCDIWCLGTLQRKNQKWNAVFEYIEPLLLLYTQRQSALHMKGDSTWGKGRERRKLPTQGVENNGKFVFGFKGSGMFVLPKITEYEEATEWLFRYTLISCMYNVFIVVFVSLSTQDLTAHSPSALRISISVHGDV